MRNPILTLVSTLQTLPHKPGITFGDHIGDDPFDPAVE